MNEPNTLSVCRILISPFVFLHVTSKANINSNMPISAEELEDHVYRTELGDSSRHFFEASELPKLKKTKRYASKLEGLDLVDDTWTGGPGMSAIWKFTFTYRDHRFLIDTNYHAGLSEFYVADPQCPDGILLEVLNHFDELFGAEGRSSSASALFFIFLLAALSILFGITAAVCLTSGDLEGAIGCGSLSVFLGWGCGD